MQQQFTIDRVNQCLAFAGLPPAHDLFAPDNDRRRSHLGCALDHLERKFGLEREHHRDGHRLKVGERVAVVEKAVAAVDRAVADAI
jgi:hypothetical protein